MDLWHTDVTEDAKYAFLLGSALRSDDLEQLFTVYDNLIPDDISQTRLQQIKEEARQISELPEHEFSSLVLNARTYSLALGRSSMSQANSGDIVQPQDNSSENCLSDSLKGDRQGRNHVIHSHVNSLESSLFNKTQLTSYDSVRVKAELGAAVEDDGSGLQGSRCKVSGLNSTGHSDSLYGDSEEDRPGSFDYMPSQSHVRITRSFNPPYDEEVKVDSSTGGSSIESPRSETSATQDEYNLAEEGTEMATLSYKETPHSLETEHKHDDDCWDYVSSKKRSDDEDMEDEENERDRLRNLYTVSSFMSALPRSVSSQFDQSISYGLKQLEGNGSGHLNPRITFTSYNQYRDQYKSEDNREKEEKKKNKHKDDTDKPEVSGLVDVNGNPRTSDKTNNPQMLQLPRGKSENAPLGNLAIPQSYSSPLADTNTLDRKKERKRMKLERQKWTPAEAYEDHKEFRDIKDILDFVEGAAAAAAASSKAEGKSVKKKQERSRKKDHHLNGTITLEDSAGGEDGPFSVETVAVTATDRAGLDAMGNSSVKPLGETKVIPRTDSAEDIFDKNIEFHDCLNSLPTQIVISSRVDNQQQSDSSENIRKYSSSDEADKTDLHSKVDDFVDKSVTDKNKVLSKKSTKTKGKKDQGPTKENGPLSLQVNMVKSKASLDMKDPLLIKSVPTDNTRSFHSASDTEVTPGSTREDSFTEVKKRKKRLVGKDFSTASVNHSFTAAYYTHNSSGYIQRNNPRPRPVTPPLPPSVAITTSVSNKRSLPVTDQTHSSRDLSPSAFPVLCPLTPHTDNRRNSCGDLSTDFIDSKTYDSDRESAKSLPDAHRTRLGGDLSPIYPMSYARIAAAPRRNDCTNSPSSESGVASGSQNSSVSSSVTHTPGSSIDIMSPQSPSSSVGMSDRKATVWKGSPRERRHSIGSGPEDKAEKEKSSVAQCNRQCGSQEVLSRDPITSVRAGSADAVTPPPAEVIHNSESSNSLQSDLDAQEGSMQHLGNLVSHKPKYSAGSARTGTKGPDQKLSSDNTSSNNTSSLTQDVFGAEACPQSKQTATAGSSVTEQKVASYVATPDPGKAKNEMPHATATISSVVSIPVGDSHVNISSSKDKVAFNSQVTKKTGTSTKSVIFLDKRFSSSPQNLGITFGFDSSYEPVCEPPSQSASQCRQPSKPQSTVVPSAAGLFAQEVCPSQAHIPPTDSTALISSDHPSSHSSSPFSDNSNLVPKGPHIQSLCNGFILPSSAAEDCVILQNQNATSGISDSSENTVTNLASSNRTSLSKLKPDSQTDHRIATPSSVVLPGQVNKLPLGVPNGSLAPINKSTPHITTGTACVALTRANPVDVIYSPNHPPPPLPPRVATVSRDRSNISNSTSSLPSRHDSIPESVKPPNCTESSVGKLTANNMKPATGGEAVDVESAVDINKALTLQSKTEAVSPKQTQFAAPAEVVPIVYGRKIKPASGCGKLMFVLNISQASKDKSADAAIFLRKKWLDNVSHTRGSIAFATLNQD